MEDTIAWLHQNLPDIVIIFDDEWGTGTYSVELLIESSAGSGYEGTVYIRSNFIYRGDHGERRESSLGSGYLKDLSQNVKVYAASFAKQHNGEKQYVIEIRCRSEGKCLGSDRMKYMHVFVARQGIEDRVARAFKHLIKLSGGNPLISKNLF